MKLQEKFKAFIDGELPAGEAAEVRRYLELRPEARIEVEDLEKLSKSIRAYVSQPEAVGLAQTLDELAARKNRKSPWLYRPGVGSALATACLLAMLFGVVRSGLWRVGSSASDATGAFAAKGVVNNVSVKSIGSASRQQFASRIDPTITGRSKRQAAAKSPMAGGFGRSFSNGEPSQSLKVNGNVEDSASSLWYRVQPSPKVDTPGTSKQPLVQKEATLGIKVKDLVAAQQAAEGIAVGNSGFVAQSNRDEMAGEAGSANLILRVPVQRYDGTIRALRALGDVVSDSSTGTDVTGDVVDMDARLRVLKAEENDYMALLSKARSLEAIMELKDKLTSIREEIESIESQRRDTKDRAVYSTINVNLTKEAAKAKVTQGPVSNGEVHDPWFADTWKSAVDGLSSAGKFIAEILIFLLVWSPLWVPFALLGMWAAKRMKW